MTRPPRFDVRIPAVQGLVAALLERPEVIGLQMRKPIAPTMPVEVGVQTRSYGSFRFWFGPSLLAALIKADESLTAAKHGEAS
jgi:hypothetical protein